MTITWSQKDQTRVTFVIYGKNGTLIHKKEAIMTTRIDEGSTHLTQYMSRVTLDNLEPGEVYSKFFTLIFFLILTVK